MGEPDQARAAGEACIAVGDALGLTVHAGTGYACLALAAMAADDPDALRDTIQTAWQRLGFRPDAGLISQIYWAEADLAAEDLPAARQQADAAIAAASRLSLKTQLMEALVASARVAAAAGDLTRAHDDAYQALVFGHGIRSRIGLIDALELLGGLAQGAEEQPKAARLLGAADALRRTTGYQRFLLHQDR